MDATVRLVMVQLPGQNAGVYSSSLTTLVAESREESLALTFIKTVQSTGIYEASRSTLFQITYPTP